MNHSPASAATSVRPHDEEIAHGAHELWCEAGKPEGRDEEFWFKAEHALQQAGRVPNVSEVIFAVLSQPVTVKTAAAEVTITPFPSTHAQTASTRRSSK